MKLQKLFVYEPHERNSLDQEISNQRVQVAIAK